MRAFRGWAAIIDLPTSLPGAPETTLPGPFRGVVHRSGGLPRGPLFSRTLSSMTRHRVPVARLTTPAEMVASVPLTLGFVPTESLVVLCCHEPRGRVGLSLRFDLPPRALEPALASDVAMRVRYEGATRVVLAVYTEQRESGARVRLALVNALRRSLKDVVITEAVLVRSGRFWSYLCDRPLCCPPEGTPVGDAAGSASVRLLAAETVLEGSAVLPDRAALVASLAGPVEEAAALAGRRCEAAAGSLADAIEHSGIAVARADSLASWAAALQRWVTPPGELGDREAAVLAVSLAEVLTRDILAGRVDALQAPMLTLLEQLCRRTPAPYDAPVCTLYAWLTYAQGGGARVGIALDRALRSDPDYPMAQLLDLAQRQQVSPQRIREIREATSEVLRNAS